jgi:hypothetical protein
MVAAIASSVIDACQSGTRQVRSVHELALRAVTAAELAVAGRAVLLPSDDRDVVESVLCCFGAGIGHLHLAFVRIHRVVVIAGFPRPEIRGVLLQARANAARHSEAI